MFYSSLQNITMNKKNNYNNTDDDNGGGDLYDVNPVKWEQKMSTNHKFNECEFFFPSFFTFFICISMFLVVLFCLFDVLYLCVFLFFSFFNAMIICEFAISLTYYLRIK